MLSNQMHRLGLYFMYVLLSIPCLLFSNNPAFIVESDCFVESKLVFDFDFCAASSTDSGQFDYSEFTANFESNAACADMSVIGGHLYRRDPNNNPHSCAPGPGNSPSMCVDADDTCSYDAGNIKSVIIDVQIDPHGTNPTFFRGVSFQERAPLNFNFITGAQGLNNYPTQYGFRVLKNGVAVYTEMDIPTSLNWNTKYIDFTGLPDFEITASTDYSIEILAYCPAGNDGEISIWDLENIEIISACERNADGGTIEVTSFEYCVQDGEPDLFSNVPLTGTVGPDSKWIITNDQQVILEVQDELTDFDLDSYPQGLCLLIHMSAYGEVFGLDPGVNVNDLIGCYGFSNFVKINKWDPIGGNLVGGPIQLCSGDDPMDYLSQLQLIDAQGPDSVYVVTDIDGAVLAYNEELSGVDFNQIGVNSCLLWFVAYADFDDNIGLNGLDIGVDLFQIDACYDLSNSVMIDKILVDGGELTGGPYEFCVGDELPDIIFDLSLTGNIGDKTRYLIVDDEGKILDIQGDLANVNFEAFNTGSCFIQHLSFENTLGGLIQGGNIANLSGCYDLSNAVTVLKNQVFGGVLVGGPFRFCTNDDLIDQVADLDVRAALGTNRDYIITNTDGLILTITDNPQSFDFEGFDNGVCQLWHIGYESGIIGLAAGENVSDLRGCFHISNAIDIEKVAPDGGTLRGGPYQFCVQNNNDDFLGDLTLNGQVGPFTRYIITDENDTILRFTSEPNEINFDDVEVGVCFIWHIAFDGDIMGAEVGNSISDITGCFDISNSIEITRVATQSGVFTGGPFVFCVGDGAADLTTGISLVDNVGANIQYIITDNEGNILDFPSDPNGIDFEDTEDGVCLLWAISYEDGLTGLDVGANANGLAGCYSLSDPISITRNQVDGGLLAGGPFNFCTRDGMQDRLENIAITGIVGDDSQYLVTDENGDILAVINKPEHLNFDVLGNGICQIWNISFQTGLQGLVVGESVSNLTGCFDLSNPLTITKNKYEGGLLEGGPFEFCVGNNTADIIEDVTLSFEFGPIMTWVVTNGDGDVLAFDTDLSDINLDQLPGGSCLLWNISHDASVTNLATGINVADLDGCHDISNALEIRKLDPNGGVLSPDSYTFCTGDDIEDTLVDLSISGIAGDSSLFVLTDNDGQILDLKSDASEFDFENAAPGICLIWNISFYGELTGLDVGAFANNITGCFELSNPVTVNRIKPNPGTFVGCDQEFCIADGEADRIFDVTLEGVDAANSQFVVTDSSGVVSALANNFLLLNFEGSAPGVCYLWNIAYENGLTGLSQGANIFSDLQGCYNFSKPLVIFKSDDPNCGIQCGNFESSITFDLNECISNTLDGTANDYSEFTGKLFNEGICSNIEVLGGNLYRPNPQVNGHSCTPGVHYSCAMCIGTTTKCRFIPNDPNSVYIDLQLTPGSVSGGRISGLSFYELAPVEFEWIEGASSINNFPTKYGVRVIKDGAVVYQEADIPTTNDWTLEYIDLSNIPELEITGTCNLRIEIGAYCPAPRGSTYFIWDLDQIQVITECAGEEILAGTLTTDTGATEFTACTNNQESDSFTAQVSDAQGDNMTFVITDTDNNILNLTNDATFEFESFPTGLCQVWNLAFDSDLQGLAVGNNISELRGCFELSNPITVIRDFVNGGVLALDNSSDTSIDICLSDDDSDMIAVNIISIDGPNASYLVTNSLGEILQVTTNSTFDFSSVNAGLCFIWHIAYSDNLTGLSVGESVADLSGCFDLSNPIQVNRTEPLGGTLAGGPFDFCVNDGIADNVFDLSLSGNVGSSSAYLITDENGAIQGLPNNINNVDFDGAGAGVCFIWHISYEPGLTGLSLNNNVSDLSGCFNISNAIQVTRNAVEGGILTGGPFSFCIGDEAMDMISGIELSGAFGANMSYILADANGNILSLPADPTAVDFNVAPVGLCQIWHISYEDGLTGLTVASNVADLDGCFDLSNPIDVNRINAEAGTLTGGPFDFCVGDGTADMVSNIALDGNQGATQWIVTDADGNILELPSDINTVDFESATAGVCFIWNLSSAGGLSGLGVGSNISGLSGCFDLSNSIQVNRVMTTPGTLSGGPFTFCVNDGEGDFVTGVNITGNIGTNDDYIITDENLNIIDVVASPSTVNFDDAGVGVCLIWHISYEDGLTGLASGQNVNDLAGCFSISNSVIVNRAATEGGTLTGGPYEFCVGDDTPDTVTDLSLSANVGTNSQYLITDANGIIIGLPGVLADVDFNSTEAGICLIWHLSYEDGISGLNIGESANNLSGCFDLSNSITVTRTRTAGGTLLGGPYSFCVGDGTADMLTDLSLSGNAGSSATYLVTDTNGNIINITQDVSSVNFDEAEAGACLIWHLSFEDDLQGLTVGQNANDLTGCFSLSNAITVDRISTEPSVLSGGPFSFCIGDGIADNVTGLTVSTNAVNNQEFIVTDENGVILEIPTDINAVDFESATVGVCFIYHISFESGLSGLTEGQNIEDLAGCFSLSNSVRVDRISTSGGTLSGGPFDFCVGDGSDDFVSEIAITGNSAANGAYVITDSNGNIVGLPGDIASVNFDVTEPGTCFIWFLSFEDGLNGLAVNNNVSDLSGCFSFSNSITVNRFNTEAATLTGGPYTLCVGDGTADMITDLGSSGGSNSSSFIIADSDGSILMVTVNIADVDFDAAGDGVCLIYQINFSGDLGGLNSGQNIDQISGCFSLSNAITVNRVFSDGGILTGGPYTFCVNDGEADLITDLVLTGSAGANQQYVITDTDLNIINIVDDITTVNFESSPFGECLIWHIGYEDISGLTVGQNAGDLSGCFDLSNSISVIRVAPNGGVLTAGSLDFCVNDGEDDFLTGINLTSASGANTQYIVTDADGVILELPSDINTVNLEGSSAGICQIYHLAYETGITGLNLGQNIDGFNGCFNLSNALTVNRLVDGDCPNACVVVAGVLSGDDATFCVNDGSADMVSGISISGNLGENAQYVITDENGVILGLPADIEVVNFDDSGLGICSIWHISYDDLTGLAVGNNINAFSGCFAISNAITVTRTAAEAGTITGGPFDFCTNDDLDDFVSNVVIDGVDAPNSQILVTDAEGNILTLPTSLADINFSGLPAGVCLVWNIAFTDGLTGLELNENVSNIMGCFEIAGPVTVNRFSPIAGTLEGNDVSFCTGDGVADNVSGISVSGNSGANSDYLITDENGVIIEVTNDPSSVDFDGAGSGICFIWHISYADGLTGLTPATNVADLSGCFALSNSITVTRSAPIAGTLVGGPYSFCVNDGAADILSDLSVTGNSGTNAQFVITDNDGNILALPTDINDFSFDDSDIGTCQVWHLSYEDGISGLAVGENVSAIAGCFGLSNAVSVDRFRPSAGTISGDATTFCVDDEMDDFVTGFSVSNNSGSNTQYILSDDMGNILMVTTMIDTVNFEGSPAGSCFIASITHEDGISGLVAGQSVANITGCFDITTPIEINRIAGDDCIDPCVAMGGNLSTASNTTFCVDDMSDDFITDITLTGNVGASTEFILTDNDNNIILTTTMIDTINFEGTEAGTCLIWSISYDDTITGLVAGENVSGLSGCFAISSNSIEITRQAGADCTGFCGAFGGTLSGSAATFCVDDMSDDFVTGISVSENTGASTEYIVTDDQGNIILTTTMIDTINFEGTEAGTCLILSISYDDTITGLVAGENVSGLSGCFAISSNSIEITRQAGADCTGFCGAFGGTLSGSAATFCVDDMSDDFVTGISVSENTGASTEYLVTDDQGNIILTTTMIDTINFEGTEAGTCLIWSISYDDTITGLVAGENVSGLSGCFAISSNSIEITRQAGADCTGFCGAEAGSLSGGPYQFCVDDNESDILSDLSLTGGQGANSQYIVTDDSGNILELPSDITTVDFEGSPAGICQVWHVNFEDGLIGLEVDLNVVNLDGCFGLSSSILVTRIAGTDCDPTCNVQGGALAGGPYEFCIGDGQPDNLSGFSVSGNAGMTSEYVITTADSTIIAVTTNPQNVNFENAGVGSCLFFNVSYDGSLDGLSNGGDIRDITGCFDFSEPIVITRLGVDGGNLMFSNGTDQMTMCVDDAFTDVFDVVLTDQVGANSVWVVTDASNNIIGLPGPPPFNFENSGVGICTIWHLSSNGDISGLELDANISQITGCVEFSNPITLTRVDEGDTCVAGCGVLGGSLTLLDGNTNIDVCVGNGISDAFTVTLGGNTGVRNWVFSNADSIITDITSGPPFDFESFPEGSCLIWNISSDVSFTDDIIGSHVNGVAACAEPSNAIVVNKIINGEACLEQCSVAGGVLTTLAGTMSLDICSGDGISDAFLVSLSDDEGTGNWVITDVNSNILSIPSGPPFEFEDAPEGTCLLWNLSSDGILTDFAPGNNLSNIVGCFDLSNSIEINKSSVKGGSLSIANGEREINICSGDGLSDAFNLTISDNIGTTNWVITDVDGVVLDLPAGPPFDLENAGAGTCLIWHLSSNGDLTGLEVGLNVTSISGCYEFSNAFTVQRDAVDGGQLTTANSESAINICSGDGISDAFGVSLSGNVGQGEWVITDINGLILDLPIGPPFDLEGSVGGVCQIWHLSSVGTITGLDIGLNVNNLGGCFDFSTPIVVNREGVSGGAIAFADGSDATTICSGDGSSDALDVTLTGNEGTGIWVITDEDGLVLDLPAGPPFDFENAGSGICKIWYLTSAESLDDVIAGFDIATLTGCFSLSNELTVTRNAVNGGDLSTIGSQTELNLCTNDGIADDFLVTLTGNISANDWVITDPDGLILDLPIGPPFSFEGVPTGTCLIWNLSSAGTITGLTVGSNVADLTGCYDFSNPITVNRFEGEDCPDPCEAEPGALALSTGGTSTTLCLDGGSMNNVRVTITDQVGDATIYVITDENNVILDTSTAAAISFTDAGSGTCFVYGLTSIGDITGLEAGNELTDISGCFELTNSVEVIRNQVDGGTLSGDAGETSFSYCVADGQSDLLTLSLQDNIGTQNMFVITDDNDNILELDVTSPIDFDGVAVGTCLVYNVSSTGTLSGLEEGDNIMDISGCYSVSNAVTVVRQAPLAGTITFTDNTTSQTICVADDVVDQLTANITGAVGDTQWVITDSDSIILETNVAQPFTFEDAPAGTCLIWSVSSVGTALPLTMNSKITDAEGCIEISEPLTVIRVTDGDLCITCELDAGMTTLFGGITETTICVGDEQSNNINPLVTGNTGTSSWIITTADSIILEANAVPPFNFESTGAGTCLIWHMSSDVTVTGLAVDASILDLGGCFALADPITVIRVESGEECVSCEANAGTISLSNGSSSPLSICVADGLTDEVDVDLSAGITEGTWILTGADSIITSLIQSPPFDFTNTPAGTCLIWHTSQVDAVVGLAVGANVVTDVEGCYDVSNPIEVVKLDSGDFCDQACSVNGGTLSFDDGTTSKSVCSGDEVADILDTNLRNSLGISNWVVTTSDSTILSILSDPPFDLEGFDDELCLIWHVATDGAVSGLAPNGNLQNLTGCSDLSNPITVVKNIVDGGVLTTATLTDQLTICVGDNVSDVLNFNLSNDIGISQWLLTDLDSVIIDVSIAPPFDFEGLDPGVCLLWHTSRTTLSSFGIAVGNKITNIPGCFDYSNPIRIQKQDVGLFCTPSCEGVSGGVLSGVAGGFFNPCVQDGVIDGLFGNVDLSGNSGVGDSWVVTNERGIIFLVEENLLNINLDLLSSGICYLRNVSFNNSFTGLEVGNNITTDLAGCYNFSNAIEIVKNEPNGGVLSGGPFSFCTGDGIDDIISEDEVAILGSAGDNSSWVISDASGAIIATPDDLSDVNFDILGTGICELRRVSYFGILTGLTVGNNDFMNLGGCVAFSNAIIIDKTEVSAGTLTGGEMGVFSFTCLGDGVADFLSNDDISLIGATGPNEEYVVTATDGTIIAIPNSPEQFNFDQQTADECRLYHIVFNNDLTGLSIGGNLLTGLDGCFGLSNFLTIQKLSNSIAQDEISGGPFLFTCVGDGNADVIADSEITLTSEFGNTKQWFITNLMGDIRYLIDSPSDIDFDTIGLGVCLIQHISFENSVEGLEVGNNVSSDVNGCYSLSNTIQIQKEGVDGGRLTLSNGDTQVGICVMDNEDDNFGITLSDDFGDNNIIVFTDPFGEVIDIPGLPPYEFNDFDPGVCLIYSISSNGAISDLAIGSNVNSLSGCYSLSNPVTITRFEDDDCVGVIVINEIFTPARFELKNIGVAPVDVSGYWIETAQGADNIGMLTNECSANDYLLDPGEVAQFVVNDAAMLNTNGQVAIHSTSNFIEPSQMVDFVQWGISTSIRANTAISAGIWSVGDFVSSIPSGMSLLYDGSGDSSSDWYFGAASSCADNISEPEDDPQGIAFEVYPNPSTGMIHFNNLSTHATSGMAYIIDVDGRIVKEQQLDLTNPDAIDISLVDLPDGMYVLRVKAGNYYKSCLISKFAE